MQYSEQEQFKNREHIMYEIKICSMAGRATQYICFLFVALGIIGDAMNTKLGLEPTSWLLLAVVAGLLSIVPNLHLVLAKHLLGMEVIKKDQE
jgi:uncharacterized protein (DUF983 family)